MNSYQKIGMNLKQMLLSWPIISKVKSYVPLSLGVSFIILLIASFGVNLGGFIPALFFYVFIISLLLCYAEGQNMTLMMGLFGYTLTRLIQLIIWFNWPDFFAMLVFGFLGWAVLKASGFAKPEA